MEHLTGETLLETVKALADDIGPRPAGHIEEARARNLLKRELDAAGIQDVTELEFPTIDTWGYVTLGPVLLGLVGSVIGRMGKLGRLLGGLIGLVSAYNLWQGLTVRGHEQVLYPLYPKHPGGSLVARIQPKGEVKHKVVLIGHTDTNKNRLSFAPQFKYSLVPAAFSLLVALVAHGVATLTGWKRIREWSGLYLGFGTAVLAADEIDGFIDGANDNASAVACVLGLGKQVKAMPLENTEVWLAFTGSEEVGHTGLNAVLERFGDQLQDALFIDFEMVGTGDIAYITRHSSLTYISPYRPDAQSAILAKKVAAKNPELGVTGRDVVIVEEVMRLRQLGYRAICVVGLGEDGWLANWHQFSDNSDHIEPESLRRAAHYVWAMLQEVDSAGMSQ